MVKVSITSIDENGESHHLFFLELPAVPRVKETLSLYGAPFGDGEKDGEALLEVFDVSYEALVNRNNSNTEFGAVAAEPIVYVRNIDGTPFRLPCTCDDVNPANGDVRGFEERELGQGTVLFVCDHCGDYLPRKTRERLISARFTAAVDATVAQRASISSAEPSEPVAGPVYLDLGALADLAGISAHDDAEPEHASHSSAKPSEPAVLERIAAQNALSTIALAAGLPADTTAEVVVARVGEMRGALAEMTTKRDMLYGAFDRPCPITGDPFFMLIAAPDGGEYWPTYGGPYDSYGPCHRTESGELFRWQYDHDQGSWREMVPTGLRVVDDDAHAVEPEHASHASAKPSEPAVLERIAAQNAHAIVEPENSKPLSAEDAKKMASDPLREGLVDLTAEAKRISVIGGAIRRCIQFLEMLRERGLKRIDPMRPLLDQEFEYLRQPEAHAAQWELTALRWELAAINERGRCAHAIETAKRTIASGLHVASGPEGRGVVHNAAEHIRNLPPPKLDTGHRLDDNREPLDQRLRERIEGVVQSEAKPETVVMKNDTPVAKLVTSFFRANGERVERIPEFFGSTTATNPALARAEIGAAYANRDYPSESDMLKEAEELAFYTILRSSKPNSPLPPHVALRLTPTDGQRFAYQFKDSFVLTGLALQVKGAGADVAEAEIDLYKFSGKRHNIAIGPLKRMVDEEMRLLRLAGVNDCVDIGSIVEGERRAAFADLRGAKNPMLLVRLEEWNDGAVQRAANLERGTPDRCYFSTGDCVFLELNNGPSNLVTPFALGFYSKRTP